MNDPKLQLAMAKLLPEKIRIYKNPSTGHTTFFWIEPGSPRAILETEWLYVMHLVEQTLASKDRAKYCYLLAIECGAPADITDQHLTYDLCCFDATFNQRATAMCRVKGIEL